MTTAEPGKGYQAISAASATLESKAAVDRKFPDLYKTFTENPKYCENSSDAYRNVILKKSITMSTSVLSEIQQFDQNSPCGFAPLIDRAYFVIKNRLCLLDYAVSRDITHHEETDDIVGVGFVAPKPGIFVDSVKQLMVIATAREVKILGIANGPDGLQFVNSFMTTLTNGVHMHQIIGTSQGRIFMLGNDDNVWELDYRARETWFTSKCFKKVHTTGNSFQFLFGKPRDRIVQLAVNEDGTILYQLTQNSSIHVVYLGTDGVTYNTAYKKHDCIADAKISNPSSSQFTPNTRIVSIHTTTKQESLSYHLVAITSNGSRIYYNNQKNAQHMNYDAEPTGLITVHVRTPSKTIAPTDVVSHCLYRNGTTLFVKNPDANPTQSQIVAYSPNLTNLGNLVFANSTAQLVEDGNTLDIHGKILNIVEVPTGSDDINELKYSYHTTSRHFLVLTTSGVTILAKQRPVDMLHNLLSKISTDTRYRLREIEPFFNQFGYLNGCSLCFNLICSANLPTADSLYKNSAISSQVVDAALESLKKFGQVTSALTDVNNLSFSSIHDGLALFVYRSVHGIWSKKLIKETASSTGPLYTNNISSQELYNVERILSAIKRVNDKNPVLFRATGASPETISYNNLLDFIDYLGEAMSFFIYLIDSNLNAIVKSVNKPASVAHLLASDIKTLLTTPEGLSTVSSDLVAALIDYTTKRYNGNIEYVIDRLTSQCGSFCRTEDVLILNAAKQITCAKTANTDQARAILADTVSTLSRIAASISYSKAVEFASQFVELGYHMYGIRLALDCAQARDCHNDATAYLDAGCPPGDSRQGIFTTKKRFYDIAIEILKNVVANPSQPASYRTDILLKALDPARNDKAFQFYTYDKFLQDGVGSVLIEVNAPNLEQYLKRPVEDKHLKLLAAYYRSHKCYDDAAKVYATLSQLQTISSEERLDYLSAAEMCARSVTAPTKLLEMRYLMDNINSDRASYVNPNQLRGL
ncbi:hypothetical protein HMPREF1544_07294 [Mucor circinelloides 1006PhL]|uniref:Nucleoporin Nup133/Nup155-like N-terminal domain-containing protein n=1 Tax=Mucor circinelloides f. circinelloides (strain 1006PhL) TaxID=1220926 RepID=S2JC38_MUCC1|nr:hypothetical protein HMPREF1544_07294 [Mucor circinelloides 1006PhL]